MLYIIAALTAALGAAWVLWCCLHRGREELEELAKRERLPEESGVHE